MKEVLKNEIESFPLSSEMLEWKNLINNFTSDSNFDSKTQFAFGQFTLTIQQIIERYKDNSFNEQGKIKAKEWVVEGLALLKEKIETFDKYEERIKDAPPSMEKALIKPNIFNDCQLIEGKAREAGLI